MRYSPTNLNGRLIALERRVNAEPTKITVIWPDQSDAPAQLAAARERGDTIITVKWDDPEEADYEQG